MTTPGRSAPGCSSALVDDEPGSDKVVDDAVNHGPQIITRHGVEVAIVISFAEYKQMLASRGKLSAFFRESPLVYGDLDLERDETDVRPDLEL